MSLLREVRIATANSDLEMVYAEPPLPLRGLVTSYSGYRENGTVLRMEPPASQAALIFGIGAPIRLTAPKSGEQALTSFYGALAGGPVWTESSGEQAGVEVSLTPVGAYRLLQRPMHDLTDRVIDLPALFGNAIRDLETRLLAAQDWESRFDLVDGLLCSLLVKSDPVDPEVAWTWRRIRRSGGQVRIDDLAIETGWSRKHLANRVRHQLGATPKRLARLVRFERFTALARTGRLIDLADTALALGYNDQSHFNRDVRDLCGETPATYLTRWQRQPGG